MAFRLFIHSNSIPKSCISRITSSSYSYWEILRNPCVVLDSNVADQDQQCSAMENPNFKFQRRRHMGHSHHQHEGRGYQSGKEGEKIIRLGLLSDIGLATGKAVTGYLSGSTAIIADAAHSITDVVLSGVALLSFKAAKAPKDKEHPYGHL